MKSLRQRPSSFMLPLLALTGILLTALLAWAFLKSAPSTPAAPTHRAGISIGPRLNAAVPPLKGGANVRTMALARDTRVVELNIPATVLLTQGSTSLLRIARDEGESLHIHNRQGVLTITTRGPYRSDKPLLLELTLPHLDQLTLRGAASANLYNLHTEDLLLLLYGVGSVRAQGRVGRLSVVQYSTGAADLSDLSARTAQLTLTGTGDLTVRVRDRVDAITSSLGTLTLRGRPTQLNITGSGSDNVQVVDALGQAH